MDGPDFLCAIKVKTDANRRRSLARPSIPVYGTIVVDRLWLQAACGTVTGNAWCFYGAAYYVQKGNGFLDYEYYNKQTVFLKMSPILKHLQIPPQKGKSLRMSQKINNLDNLISRSSTTCMLMCKCVFIKTQALMMESSPCIEGHERFSQIEK